VSPPNFPKNRGEKVASLYGKISGTFWRISLIYYEEVEHENHQEKENDLEVAGTHN
jgi:hypothetical protein